MKLRSFFLLFMLAISNLYANTPKNLIQNVLQAIQKSQNFEGYSRMIEKTGSKVSTNISFSKLSYTPFRFYMTNIAPEAGMQALYNPKATGGKFYVKTPPFTFITLKLDPNSSFVRGNYHHPLDYNGTIFAARILQKIYQNTNAYNITYSTGTFHSRQVYQILLKTKNFHYLTYTVQKRESVQSLCSRLLINEYVVLTRNDNIHSYNQVLEPNMKILIPSHFFKQLLVFIDQENYLPLVEKIWDDQGFLEQYDMYDIKIKSNFKPHEFLPQTYGMN